MSFSASGPESPLQSFARRYNHNSLYRMAVPRDSSADRPHDFAGNEAVASENGDAQFVSHAVATLTDDRRQLQDELEYIDKQKELEALQIAIDTEKHTIANRRVMLNDRETELQEAQHTLQEQQAALLREIAAAEQDKQRMLHEMERLELANESLHAKQRQVHEDTERRKDAKSHAFKEAKRLVTKAQDQSAFNALDDALRSRAQLSVMRAIIENHIGGVNVPNTKYNSWTALHYAAWHGHETLCELLVAHGADVLMLDTYSKYTPLDWAQSRGHSAAASFLTAAGSRRGVALIKDASFSSPTGSF